MPKSGGVVALTLLTACAAQPVDGLRDTPDGDGPMVRFDPLHQPLPDIPLPSDLATRFDADAVTGRRVNVGTHASTRFERLTRERFNELDGFAPFGPITVSFDAPIDLAALSARHGDHDFGNDAVFVIDLETGAPVALDLGRGNFPVTLERSNRHFDHDPKGHCVSVLFGCDEGGSRTNNRRSHAGDAYDEILDYYDLETNTLILRPVVPLRPAARYAVVLTERLMGEGGQPVRSPFAFVHHTAQLEDLENIDALLKPFDSGLHEVAFAWSFTTQSSGSELEAIRLGLDGEGPLRWMARNFPAEISGVPEVVDGESLPEGGQYNVHTAPGVVLQEALDLLLPAIASDFGVGNEAFQNHVRESYEFVDYVVQGQFLSPNLRVPQCPGEEGFDPLADDHVFELNVKAGRARAVPCPLAFLAVVPKAHSGFQAPFPVVLYAHGTGGNTLQALIDAGYLARHGYATVAIDVTTHGLVIPPSVEFLASAVFQSVGLGPIIEGDFYRGRAYDVSGDGTPDPAAQMWTGDLFRTRDNVRQTLVDFFHLARLMKSFDGERRWAHDLDADGSPELAGDFNADGTVDFGGPEQPFFTTGVSLGGIVAALLLATHPDVLAAAPISAGAGMTDIALRQQSGDLIKGMYPAIMGPIVTGLWEGEGAERRFTLAHQAIEPSVFSESPEPACDGDSFPECRLIFAELRNAQAGDRVVLRNLENGEIAEGRIPEEGPLRLHLASDRGDRWELEHRELVTRENAGSFLFMAESFEPGQPLVALHSGLGLSRNTEDFRRMFEVAPTALASADPASYAARMTGPRPGREAGGLLLHCTPGDMTVAVSSCVALARAAGIVPYLEPDAQRGMTLNDFFIAEHVTEGIDHLRFGASRDAPLLFDPDDLDFGLDGLSVPTAEPPVRRLSPHAGLMNGLRFPFISLSGAHGVFSGGGERDSTFDHVTATMLRIGTWFESGATVISDEACLEDLSCE